MSVISEVTYKYKDGMVDYALRIYPGQADTSDIIGINVVTDEILPRRIKLSRGTIVGLWEVEIKRIRTGTGLLINLEFHDGTLISFVPLSESDVVNGVVRIPDIDPSWFKPKASNTNGATDNQTGGMRILLEHTLEGLLAEYEDGVYFTDACEELLDWSIADRLIRSKIPEKLAELGYNELMVPIYASVADRCNLDPKFNYLVYNISPDWQLGSAKEIRSLVHRFRGCGIEIIPDLVFVHQVKNPFEGSSDAVSERRSHLKPYKDEKPFLFRDYGTWYFNLEDKLLREILLDKIVQTIIILDLNAIRVDYIDGLLMQYCNRPVNYSALFLRELKQRIQQARPWLQIIGEAFQTASDPSVVALIDSAYVPRGFGLLDLMLAPGTNQAQILKGSIDSLTQEILVLNNQSKRESNYCQLHDECWRDEWISMGRPHTPWAYGKMPLGLCLERVDEMLTEDWIEIEERIQTAVSLMLLIRTLGLTLSFNRWMETTGCLSLDQGTLDDIGHWKFPWNIDGASGRSQFPADGLPTSRRLELVNAARKYVSTVNHLLQKIGTSAINPFGDPLRMVHGDCNNGVGAFVRWGQHYPNPLLVIVNLSPNKSAIEQNYQFNLSPAGWRMECHPPTIKALTQPITETTAENIVLTQNQFSPHHYRISRPLYGFECAIFELPIYGL